MAKADHSLTLNQRVFVDWLGCNGGKVRVRDLRLAAFSMATLKGLHGSDFIKMTHDDDYNSYWTLTEQGLLAYAASPYAALGLLKDQPALEMPL